ncbi:MAG: U32 family peptidase [Tannerellaceae bacterium]|jgi:collagenase-like PrtC family protease|nr:U32 family peptidase [Tannerellaceae bacterium]
MKTYNIIAPVCSIETLEPLLEAGADEVYFGIMPATWIKNYGAGDTLSRRQSEYAHFSLPDAMSEIVHTVRRYGRKATLTLNSRYSCGQLPFVCELIEQWEDAGGDSLMVADMEILQWLNKRPTRLERHLSVMAGVFNSQSVAFFKSMNVSRIVLPRELSLEEFAELSETSDGKIDFEVIAMFQKCEFIDTFCNFYHAVNYRPYLIDRSRITVDVAALPGIASSDRAFEGHGCQLPFRCGGVRLKHLENNDMKMPFCAACMMDFFISHGIRHFKIAGRGYPNDMIIRAISFLRRTIESQPHNPDKIQNDYRQLFGQDCKSKKCYYFSAKPPQKNPPIYVTVKHIRERKEPAMQPNVYRNCADRQIEWACFVAIEQLTDKKTLENTSFKDFDRIYFGHETCERLLPAWNNVSILLDIARTQNIKTTFVSPFLTNAGMKRTLCLLEQIVSAGNEIDVVTSDWGLLFRLISHHAQIPVAPSRFLVGQQLDFRMKYIHNHYEDRVLHIDGTYYRLEYAPPSPQMREHLSQCTLLKPATLDFLSNRGISRLELSNVYQTIKLPETDNFHYSIYLPFAPVTVFRNCADQHDFNNVQPVCSRMACCADHQTWQTSCADPIVRRDNALYYRHADLSGQLEKNPLIDRIVLL